jgi:hypothetical protein
MRRYLGAFTTVSAVASLALGCSQIGDSNRGTGGAGGDAGAYPPSGAGNGGSSGAGVGSGAGAVVEAVDTAPPPPTKIDAAACVDSPNLSDPVFLSVPHARALVSAAQVRGILEAPSGAATPVPSLVRTNELLNYYHIDYPAQSPTELTIVAELVPTDVPSDYLLQIGVQAPTAKAHRRPTSLTVLVDTSTSMEGESMKRANAAVLALAASLNKDDVLNLLTTDSERKPVHRRAASDGDPALFPANEPFTVSGADSFKVGVEHAYELATAADSYLTDGINRVVVITDGGGPATAIDTSSVQAHWTDQQIRLVGVGVGSAPSYHNELLAAATTAGHGANVYLDSVAEADIALHQRFDEIMDEAASAVTVSFRVPWMFTVVNPDASGAMITESALATSDLARGRSMVFRHIVTRCSTAPLPDLANVMMEVTANWSAPGMVDRQAMTVPIQLAQALLDKPSYPILKTSAILAFGGALQSLQVSRFQDACAKAVDARAHLGSISEDPELDSILKQLQAHPVMKGVPCQ